LIGWAIFGGLVVVGFAFGLVVGYEAPKPISVAKAPTETPKAPERLEVRKEASEPRKETAAKPAPAPKAEAPSTNGNPPKLETKIDSRTASTPTKQVEPKPEALVQVSFQKEVLPVLRAHCLNCHGGGKGKPKGDVNLTSIAAMRRSPGKILVPGKPEESDVYTSITERDMPDGGRPKPTARELETLRNWIFSGAKERRRIVKRRRISRLTATRDYR